MGVTRRRPGSVRRRSGWPSTLALALLATAVLAGWLFIGRRERAPVTVATTIDPPRRITFVARHYPVLSLPDGRARAVRSVLRVDRPMRFGDYVWNDARVPRGSVWVRVDLAAQTISVFRADEEIGTAVVLYGTDNKPTPTGSFPILERAEQHRSSLYDADMPYMLRLTSDGVAIHASSVRQGSATHGCIGVPFGFAQLLFKEVRRGDLVAILPATPAAT